MTDDRAAAAPGFPDIPVKDALYLSDLAYDHGAQVQAGSESLEHALRTVAVCSFERAFTARDQALAALVAQFQHSREDCNERARRERRNENEAAANADWARAEVWGLAARCLAAVLAGEGR